jgi:hypothetical protein
VGSYELDPEQDDELLDKQINIELPDERDWTATSL